MTVKDFKDYIRVLKEFKAYGNFMWNMNGCDLYYFINNGTRPYNMINMHACWAQTQQGQAYWSYLHNFIFHHEKPYFECLKYKNFKKQCMDGWKNEIAKENETRH